MHHLMLMGIASSDWMPFLGVLLIIGFLIIATDLSIKFTRKKLADRRMKNTPILDGSAPAHEMEEKE